MTRTLGKSPGRREHPQHVIDISRDHRHRHAELRGTTLADSQATLIVRESGYPDATYFPPAAVCWERLHASDHRSTCPFKGEASYIAVERDGELMDAGWFYPQVYDEVAALAGFVAFYDDRVTLQVSV